MTYKTPAGKWYFDGSAEPGILDAIWKGISAWYAEGLQLHPTIFCLSPANWRNVMTEGGEAGSKSGVIGIQETLTPDWGKRNAIVFAGPVVGAWLFFAEPGLRSTIRVLNKDWAEIGDIETW